MNEIDKAGFISLVTLNGSDIFIRATDISAIKRTVGNRTDVEASNIFMKWGESFVVKQTVSQVIIAARKVQYLYGT